MQALLYIYIYIYILAHTHIHTHAHIYIYIDRKDNWNILNMFLLTQD